jgi:hypothetical protein
MLTIVPERSTVMKMFFIGVLPGLNGECLLHPLFGFTGPDLGRRIILVL